MRDIKTSVSLPWLPCESGKAGWLTNHRAPSHSSGGQKSKVKVSAGLLLRGLQIAPACSPCLHMVFSLCESGTEFPLLIRAVLLDLHPPSGPHSNLITPSKALSANRHILRSWGLGLQRRNLGGDTVQARATAL